MPLFLGACSHSTSKPSNDWYVVGGAVAAGALVGASTAPSYEKPESHAVFWGAVLGAGSALALEIFRDSTAAVSAEKRLLEQQIILEQLLKPTPPVLASEGVVKKDALIWDLNVKKDSTYRLYQLQEYRIISPKKVELIERRLELKKSP